MWVIPDRGKFLNLDSIKQEIKNNLNQAVSVTVYGMRNKTNKYVGIISGIYPNIFTVLADGENKSFSYADVATKEIEIEYI